MKSGLLRILIVSSLLAAAGCVDEEFSVVINKDGSGTVGVERVLDDRITVMLEEVDKLADFPFFDFAELGKALLEGVDVLEQNGFTIADRNSQSLDDGTMKQSFSAAFDGPDKLASGDMRQELPVVLSRGEDGNLLCTVDLLPMGPDEGMAPAASQDGPPLGILYALLKGYHRKVSVTAPVPFTSDSGTLSADKKTVSWEFDLRNRDALKHSRDLFAKAVMGRVSASAPLKDLAANLPELAAVEPAPEPQEPDQEEQKKAAPETRPASGKYLLSLESIESNRVRPIDPPGSAEVTQVAVNLKLTWGEGTAYIRSEEPKLQPIKDDAGNEVEPAGTSWSTAADDESPGHVIQLYLAGVGPDSKKLVGFKGTLPVVSAKTVKKITLTPKQLQAADGQETTGIAALDELKGSIHELSDTGFSLLFGEEDPDNNASLLSATLIKSTGEREAAWSSSCSWGDCSIDFSTPLAEAESIEIEIPAGEVVEELPFSAEEIPLP